MFKRFSDIWKWFSLNVVMQRAWAGGLALPLINCVVLASLLASGSELSQLENVNDNGTCSSELLWGKDQIMHMKHLASCLACGVLPVVTVMFCVNEESQHLLVNTEPGMILNALSAHVPVWPVLRNRVSGYDLLSYPEDYRAHVFSSRFFFHHVREICFFGKVAGHPCELSLFLSLSCYPVPRVLVRIETCWRGPCWWHWPGLFQSLTHTCPACLPSSWVGRTVCRILRLPFRWATGTHALMGPITFHSLFSSY